MCGRTSGPGHVAAARTGGGKFNGAPTAEAIAFGARSALEPKSVAMARPSVQCNVGDTGNKSTRNRREPPCRSDSLDWGPWAPA
jgi:hypothetical protein